MRTLVIKLLTWSAKRQLAKHKPTIIAVTGSVGKTSTREAIAIVLGSKLSVRTAKKNLNTEIGVPLAILGLGKPHSIWGWLMVCFQALDRSYRSKRSYPSYLVLEFGADRPGDIAHLCELAPPNVGVVTPLSPVHVVNYPSFEDLIKEKSELPRALPSNGLCVLTADDDHVLAMREITQAPVVTYGSSDKAEMAVVDYALEVPTGICLAVDDRRTAEEPVVLSIKGTFGMQQASVAAAALAVGVHFGIRLTDGANALAEHYTAPPGRMKPLSGIKGTLLLDDSYNGAPASMAAALLVLKAVQPTDAGRRIAALGEMAELGAQSEEEHRQLGWKVAEAGVDLLVLAGEKTRDTARGALEAGMKDKQIVLVKNSVEAGRYLDRAIKPGDVVLVKGSQSSRMEKTLKDLLLDPTKASELLVRQEAEWL